jgi:hypothetical protein
MMFRSRVVASLAALGIVVSCAGSAHTEWSATSPRINLTHLFHGEINKNGKPVGFHSRPGSVDPADAGLHERIQGPNRKDVYMARIWVRGKDKSKISTFFPDSMKKDDVINAILNAFNNKTSFKAYKFTGPSGRGFNIEGFVLDNGDINTAYPVYREER